MPPAAAEENHPPLAIPNDPEDVEGEESDDYEVEVGGNSYGLHPSLVNLVLYRMMTRANTKKMRTRTRKMMMMKQNRTE